MKSVFGYVDEPVTDSGTVVSEAGLPAGSDVNIHTPIAVPGARSVPVTALENVSNVIVAGAVRRDATETESSTAAEIANRKLWAMNVCVPVPVSVMSVAVPPDVVDSLKEFVVISLAK